MERIVFWFLPILAVGLFFWVERKKLGKSQIAKRPYLSICLIELINFCLNLGLSYGLIFPLVNLYAPLQIISVMQLPLPLFICITIAYLLIDFVYYFSHRAHHAIPALWRLHRLHHADEGLDTVTTLLHHPLETVTNFLIVTLFFVIFDIPVVFLIYYYVAQSIHAAWSHTHVLLPHTIDKWMRYLVVTPNMHRIHHSKDRLDGNRNFGGILSIWDYLFGSYGINFNAQNTSNIFGVNHRESLEHLTIKDFLLNPLK